MGDRAMAQINTDGGSLYVYTHWGGYELPENTEKAIKKAMPRIEMDDLPYATKIIVDQLTKEGRDEETGFGILLEPDAEDEYNNDNPSVIIDLKEKTLTTIREGKTKHIPFREL